MTYIAKSNDETVIKFAKVIIYSDYMISKKDYFESFTESLEKVGLSDEFADILSTLFENNHGETVEWAIEAIMGKITDDIFPEWMSKFITYDIHKNEFIIWDETQSVEVGRGKKKIHALYALAKYAIIMEIEREKESKSVVNAKKVLSCKTCDYFMNNECYLNPPTPIITKQMNQAGAIIEDIGSVRPTVYENDFCSYHSKKNQITVEYKD